MTVLTSLLRAWFGEEEYHDAWHKRSRTRSFSFRFWGRLMVASAGRSDVFATLVLALTASQGAGPLIYLLFQVTERFFLSEHYLETLREGRFYGNVKSALCIVLMTALSILAVYGVLGTRWYIKPLVFFLTIPVAWFWVCLPALNWVGVRVRGFTTYVPRRWARANQHRQQPA